MSDDFKCANCGHVAPRDELPPAKDGLLRHTPGDTYSDVECPHCGALCFPDDPDAGRRSAIEKHLQAAVERTAPVRDSNQERVFYSLANLCATARLDFDEARRILGSTVDELDGLPGFWFEK